MNRLIREFDKEIHESARVFECWVILRDLQIIFNTEFNVIFEFISIGSVLIVVLFNL